MSQVTLVPILLWVAALASAVVAIWQGPRPIDRSFVIDRLLRYLFVFPLALLGLWAFLGHIFFAEQSAASIGWAPSPFQYEVGIANLGLALAALYAAFRGYEARLAVGIAAACFSSEPALDTPGTSSRPAILRRAMPGRSWSPTFSRRSPFSRCSLSPTESDGRNLQRPLRSKPSSRMPARRCANIAPLSANSARIEVRVRTRCSVVRKYFRCAITSDEQHVVGIALCALLHPWRADRHAGNSQSHSIGLLGYEPLDVRRGPMAFDDIALGGMAGGELGADPGL